MDEWDYSKTKKNKKKSNMLRMKNSQGRSIVWKNQSVKRFNCWAAV